MEKKEKALRAQTAKMVKTLISEVEKERSEVSGLSIQGIVSATSFSDSLEKWRDVVASLPRNDEFLELLNQDQFLREAFLKSSLVLRDDLYKASNLSMKSIGSYPLYQKIKEVHSHTLANLEEFLRFLEEEE